jgi:hypothetical protein
MATCGVVVGCIAALWASRALSAFPFELSPPAALVPARRAASVDPARVLRAE